MALSILSYNLPSQGLKMSANNSSPSTGDENSSNSITGGGGRTTINIGKSFSRITMQNVLSESNGNALNISNNNNVNTIVRKIKDIGMYGSVNNAGAISATISVRKRTNSETSKPQSDSSATNENKAEKAKLTNKRTKSSAKKNESTSEKPGKTTITKAVTPSTTNRPIANTPGSKKPAGTPGRKGLPLPQAVARRNARERNRVKQVNNGFAALRERIPEEVAEAFEAQGNGRGTVKKLSKVETLRMAVEYIRSLERLLGYDFPIGCDRGLKLLQSGSFSDDSFTFIKDEFDALSPPLDDTTNFDDSLSHYDVDEYLNNNDFGNQSISESSANATDSSTYDDMDLLPSLTTINGLQYVRIPGTNTYQLLTPDMLFMTNAPHSPPTSSLDEESFQALIDTNCLSPIETRTTSPPHISPASVTSINAAPATKTIATGGTLQQQQQQQQHDVMTATSAAVAATLSRSPVQSSPTMHSSLHQQQQQNQQQEHQQFNKRQPQTPTPTTSTPTQGPSNLSPAANNDTLLLQTCATTNATFNDEIDGYAECNENIEHQNFLSLTTPTTPTIKTLQPSHAIKQEFNDTFTTNFVPASETPSPTKNFSSDVLLFRQQLQDRLLLRHTSLSTMSPPLERCSSSAISTSIATTTPTILYVPNSATTPTTPGRLSTFYDGEQDNSYYESTHTNILKKEYNDTLLQAAAAEATENNMLSSLPDENIIEVMDWWESHTPKSDGSVALM